MKIKVLNVILPVEVERPKYKLVKLYSVKRKKVKKAKHTVRVWVLV